MNTPPFEESQLKKLTPEFVSFSHMVNGESASGLTPKRLVHLAARALPHVSGCALTIASAQGRPRTLASSAQIGVIVDAIQYETRQGPCLEALDSDELVLVNDLTTDERWPVFSRRCVAETPVRAMLGVRLRLGTDDRAAMNFYTEQVGSFSDIDLGVASMFAPFVAMSVQNALEHRRADNLEVALQSSRQIGTAMGILMANRLITADAAFELLRRASQDLNRKLREIAEEVELTGTLPFAPGIEPLPRRG